MAHSFDPVYLGPSRPHKTVGRSGAVRVGISASSGSETLRLLSIEKETRVTRVDYPIGDADGAYDPRLGPEYGLEIDTMRVEVLQKQDDAVERY